MFYNLKVNPRQLSNIQIVESWTLHYLNIGQLSQDNEIDPQIVEQQITHEKTCMKYMVADQVFMYWGTWGQLIRGQISTLSMIGYAEVG